VGTCYKKHRKRGKNLKPIALQELTVKFDLRGKGERKQVL